LIGAEARVYLADRACKKANAAYHAVGAANDDE